MIELETQTRRKSVVVDDDPPSNYLVLGDFGGRAAAPMAIDRDNFDGVLSRMDVHVAGTPFRELDDFHPDRLFQRLPLFRDFDAAHSAESPEESRNEPSATLAVDIGELLRPSGL